MAGTTLDIQYLENMQDALAKNIVDLYTTWDMAMAPKKDEWRELRNYVFATDTRKTANSVLPWKNSTTVPKLCQIRDNLHSNYMAALFPHEDWMVWEAGDKDSATSEKRDAVMAYMKNKTLQSKFRATVSELIYDYIDHGNVFAGCEWVNESKVDPITKETIQGYIGPRLVRTSPFDIRFNPIAARFVDSPKIIRALKSFGEFKKGLDATTNESDKEMFRNAMAKAEELRRRCSGIAPEDMPKADRYQIDGFGSYHQYLMSGTVEVLTFYGDIWDADKNVMLEDHQIVILDRQFVIQSRPNPSWIARNEVRHVGWRLRQDNLWAMGPLDNLVGMQYRIDHLENLRADVFDMIAFPMQVIKGNVEPYEYGPGKKIITGDDGAVDFLRPDATALNADTQISMYENKMEEMAGAPKQAMGFRTPGEKTAYEVQSLENAAGRIFQNKVAYFEEMIIEPILNDMLEMARRNMQSQEVLRVLNDTYGVELFTSISKEDITAVGKIRPRGASVYARRNILLQNLSQFLNSAYAQDPDVKVHLSGYNSAKAFSELLGLNDYDIVKKNIRLQEEADIAATQRSLQNTLMEEQMQNPDGTPSGQDPQALLGLVDKQLDEQGVPQ